MRDETEGKDAENHIYEWAVKVLDEELSRVLADRRESWHEFREEFGYENLPYVETEEFRKIVSKETTVDLGGHMKNERMAILKYFVSRAERPELKHKRLWMWLYQYLQTHGNDYITQHLSGDMGSGKTDFAIFEARLWKLNHPDGEILSNIESFEQATTVLNQDELDEWIEENPDTDYFFVFDEANKHASGTGDSSAVEDQLYPLVTFIRKNDGNLVIIGHNPKDIHKWVRELCDFVHKTGLKTAKFYNSVGENGEPEGHFKTLRNIPQTSYDYDTNEVSDWSWADDKVQVCIGTNKEGERCSTPLRFDYDEEIEYFCDTHHNQSEPHPDVPAEELEETPYAPTDGSDDDRGEPVLSEDEEENVDGQTTQAGDRPEETPEEVRSSDTDEENPTQTADADNEQDTYTIENIPSEGWKMIYEKSRMVADDIDDWDMVEKILNDRELSDLKRMMD
ncbi:hypothetical protein HZS55_12920 [Halosimplex rubrum]|uniref:Uncharacterized protein n=1 Tax=Halosimplex rubrum TaxID=869889 RepID=A0A7D5T510_9EURY|nr:hypothetical protein [Halosimplex rubrum]QLH78150.1 hypothetical protein HZS55_12920 [Halosimplex rubrum]